MGKYSDYIMRAQSEEERCQSVTARGQCQLKKMPDSEFCPCHGGNRAFVAARKQRRRLYDVERYKKKIATMQDHEGANSFREEIAVLRMMLETRLNQCQDDHDLMLHSQVISNLISGINTAVTSATRLEKELGKLFSEEQASAFAMELLEIISNHVTDPLVLDEISNDLLESLDRFVETRGESVRPDLSE